MVKLAATLPDGTLDSSVNAFINGLDGRTVFLDSSLTSTSADLTYFDASRDRPLTLLESLNSVRTTLTNSVNDLRDQIASESSGLTTDQKDAIGANIFDSGSTSSSTSLAGKSENNRLNLIQVANDIYGAGYSLDNNGSANLTYSLMAQVDALLQIHNGAWDSDIAVDHTGVPFTATQTSINSSVTVNDSFAGATTNLEDDLNQIRTRIKETIGGAVWTTTMPALYGGGASTLKALLDSTAGTGAQTATNPWGYNYTDVDGVETRFDAVRDFTGQTTHTDDTTAYLSTVYIDDGDPLETAIGRIDAVVGSGTFNTDLEVLQSGNGIILLSPDGSRFRVQVSNTGALTTTSI
jgi:hypothetical protein